MERGVFLYEKTCRHPWEADDAERLVSVTMSLRMLCSVCRSKGGFCVKPLLFLV